MSECSSATDIDNKSVATRSRTSTAAEIRPSMLNILRQELASQCCLIRMQYHPITRNLFEMTWRLLFIADFIGDIMLCLQYKSRSLIWWTFVSVLCVPYIVSAICLFLPFHRRYLQQHSLPLVLSIAVYSVLSVPCIVCLDFYICLALLFTDLSTTRYLLYYWRLKTLIELILETLPQTLLLICIGLGWLDTSSTTNSGSSINVQLLYGSLSISIAYLVWYCIVIYYGAQSVSLSIADYLYQYYIMQGIDMIPYQEAMTQNLLSDFALNSENLTQREWAKLIQNLFTNYSIVTFDISHQQHLNHTLWLHLFHSLANNNLRAFNMRACFLFHPHTFSDGNYKQLNSNSILTKYKSRKSKYQSPSPPNADSSSEENQKKTKLKETKKKSPFNLVKAGFLSLILNVPTLVVVDLRNNYLFPVFREMIKPLSTLKKLKELYVAQNQLARSNLTDNEYLMLLRGCVSLTVLDLSDNELTDGDVECMCAAIEKCREKQQLQHLANLKLDCNQICEQGAQQLMNMMRSFKRLSIDLQHTNIDDEALQRIQKTAALNVLIEE